MTRAVSWSKYQGWGTTFYKQRRVAIVNIILALELIFSRRHLPPVHLEGTALNIHFKHTKRKRFWLFVVQNRRFKNCWSICVGPPLSCTPRPGCGSVRDCRWILILLMYWEHQDSEFASQVIRWSTQIDSNATGFRPLFLYMASFSHASPTGS